MAAHAHSNVAFLTSRARHAVEPLKFTSMSVKLQTAVLEWMQQDTFTFAETLENTAIVGRTTVLFDVESGRILNERSLRIAILRADYRLRLISRILQQLEIFEIPQAFNFLAPGKSARTYDFLIIPLRLNQRLIYAVTVDGW